MKSRISALVLASAAIAAAAMATVPAVAATSQTLNVPFSFTVAGKQLPAGQYRVSQGVSTSIVNLQSVDATYHFSAIASPSATDDGRVVLKFGGNGQTHVLQSIQMGPMITSRLDGKKHHSEDVSPEYPVGQ